MTKSTQRIIFGLLLLFVIFFGAFFYSVSGYNPLHSTLALTLTIFTIFFVIVCVLGLKANKKTPGRTLPFWLNATIFGILFVAQGFLIIELPPSSSSLLFASGPLTLLIIGMAILQQYRDEEKSKIAGATIVGSQKKLSSYRALPLWLHILTGVLIITQSFFLITRQTTSGLLSIVCVMVILMILVSFYHRYTEEKKSNKQLPPLSPTSIK